MSALDDAIGEMVDDLLDEAGRTVTYLRDGVSAGSVTMSRQQQPGQWIDAGNGGLVEVVPVDWVAKTADLPFDPPQRGDRLIDGDEAFEVSPTTGEKVFRRLSPQMTRLHTKQVLKR